MREGQPVPLEAKDKKMSPVKKWAQRIVLGAALAGGGYEVGHEQGRSELEQSENEHIEEDAEELAERLNDMVSLIDELRSPGIVINREKKERELVTDYKIDFAHAVGMSPDLQPDITLRVTWPESSRADEIYRLINQVLVKQPDAYTTQQRSSILSAAQRLMGEKENHE